MFEFCVILTAIQVVYILFYLIGYERLKRERKYIFVALVIGIFYLGYFFKESIVIYWPWLKNSNSLEFICVVSAIQTIFLLYHISSSKWIKAYFKKLIFFISICFLAFSVILFELIREIYQLIIELKTIGEGAKMFYWEWQRGLILIVNNLSCYMALAFINMMIVLIILFYKTHRLKNV